MTNDKLWQRHTLWVFPLIIVLVIIAGGINVAWGEDCHWLTAQAVIELDGTTPLAEQITDHLNDKAHGWSEWEPFFIFLWTDGQDGLWERLTKSPNRKATIILKRKVCP